MRLPMLKMFCTYEFFRNHISIVSDGGPNAKKRANLAAVNRDVNISTMIRIDEEYYKLLWGELRGKNRGTYKSESEIYETADAYMFHENVNAGNARVRGPARFKYKVRFNLFRKYYQICHFDGLV